MIYYFCFIELLPTAKVILHVFNHLFILLLDDYDIQIIAKPVLELLQQPTTYLQWKCKCLVLFIVIKLLDYAEYRQTIWGTLNPLFYLHFLSDSNETLRTCIFQLIEKFISIKDAAWVDWYDCLLGMGEASDWMKWTRRQLPNLDDVHRIHNRLLLCINTPAESIHRDDLLHFSLFILEGVVYFYILCKLDCAEKSQFTNIQ